jgi:ribosomal protein S19
MASSEDHVLKQVTERWNELNKNLEHVPKFQNKKQTGVSEEHIKEVESKLKINLPKEIRTAVKVHNGRKHIGYGLGYRLPTTDLLPISQWKPYEIDNDQFPEDLFRSLADKTDACADKNLQEDAREHLNIYSEGIKKDQNYKLANDKTFQSLSCELLIIGQGMDDYAEQYLLSIRSGRIYLAVHNIPEWRLVGTFNDWIEQGLSNVKDQNDELKEQHDDIEVS